MKTKYDIHKASHEIADGQFFGKDSQDRVGQHPLYSRMVVLDVIFDPQSIDDVKIDYWQHTLKIKNIRFSDVLPRNTIIGQRINDGSSNSSDPPMFLFPFFPSHIQLPCKAGEHVWVMFEHPDARYSEMGYWMCRITEPSMADDVNHTHSPRQFDPSFVASTRETFNGDPSAVYENRNGIVDKAQNERYTRGSTAFIPGPEDAYEKLITSSDAGKIAQYEAVPRVRKRPGDVVIEGSNNASIVIGTDRIGPVASYNHDDGVGNTPIPTQDLTGQAGSIDIVTGRGQTPDTGGVVVSSMKIMGGELKKEIGKSKKELKSQEGDPDFKNDRSRLLLSQRTLVDKNFTIDGFNTKNFDISDANDGSGAIVLKTDKLRLIARSDIQILVSGVGSHDANGNMIESTDQSTWASITVKANGDIVFKPASTGVIKLGGDDANLAVLCQQAITGPNDHSGNVTAAPILDSMGGAQGGGGASGQFSTKVLLK